MPENNRKLNIFLCHTSQDRPVVPYGMVSAIHSLTIFQELDGYLQNLKSRVKGIDVYA
jgi:hypothetical protein